MNTGRKIFGFQVLAECGKKSWTDGIESMRGNTNSYSRRFEMAMRADLFLQGGDNRIHRFAVIDTEQLLIDGAADSALGQNLPMPLVGPTRANLRS